LITFIEKTNPGCCLKYCNTWRTDYYLLPLATMRSTTNPRPPVIKHIIQRILRHSSICFKFLVGILLLFTLVFRKGIASINSHNNNNLELDHGSKRSSSKNDDKMLPPFMNDPNQPPCAVFVLGVPFDNIGSLIPQIQQYLEPNSNFHIPSDSNTNSNNNNKHHRKSSSSKNTHHHTPNNNDDHAQPPPAQQLEITFTQVCSISDSCAKSSTMWGEIEDRLLIRGGYVGDQDEWRAPPSWMGWGYHSPFTSSSTSNNLPVNEDEFVQEASEEIDKMNNRAQLHGGKLWYVYSPRLFLTVGDWLRVLKSKQQQQQQQQKLPLNSICIIITHKSRTRQLMFALSTLRQRHLSAFELMGALDYLRMNGEEQCKSAGARLIWLIRGKSGEWEFSNTEPIYVDHHHEPEMLETTIKQLWIEAVNGKVKIEQNIRFQNSNNENEWPTLVKNEEEAYVAVLTASNMLYAKGAMVLGRSLAFFDSSRERVLLTTSDVDESVAHLAESLGGWTIKPILKVEQNWFRKCKWKSTRVSQEIRWGEMASKLRIFDLIEKKIAIYMDADVVATGRLGDLFAMSNSSPELQKLQVISEGGIQHEFVNAGVMLIRPNHTTFEGMIQHYRNSKPPEIFGNLIDCTEMGLINAYFGKPSRLVSNGQEILSKQPELESRQSLSATLSLSETDRATFGRPDIMRDYKKYAPFVVHFMREDKCPKPWTQCPGAILPGEKDLADAVIDMKYARCSSFPYHVWCTFHFGSLPNVL
jgi:hypothetical protein